MAHQITGDRRLRVFAFDPQIGRQFRFAKTNEVVVTIPRRMEAPMGVPGQPAIGGLGPGPVGEYLEVVDYDPSSRRLYSPVRLDDYVASQGLAPSESDPRFHQQMVYAVAMRTIAVFEAALGRVALWAPRERRDAARNLVVEDYVGRLRLYPHAIREANAYYAPDKKAVLFGYFAADDRHPRLAPGSTVFTCLSHDIIAHEVTHALLDGMHSRFVEATNHDVLALHEAVADIVALFQHFSHSEVLLDQIARTRGDLETENLLGQLAQEFGQALGRGGALRDALGQPDADGVWRRRRPDRTLLARATAPHQRGAILVAAVFDLFIALYHERTEDLFRIASSGTGILPPGAIHPDLAARLAQEAAKTAEKILRLCVRALDYCPPVDVRFGDYLRAIVTADHDLYPEDERRYRVAIIEAFVAWGIVPEGMRTVTTETLLWPSLDDVIHDKNASADDGAKMAAEVGTLIENPNAILDWIDENSKARERVDYSLKEISAKISDLMRRGEANRFGPLDQASALNARGQKFDAGQLLSQNLLMLGLGASREMEWWAQKLYRQIFWAFLTSPGHRKLLKVLHLTMDSNAPQTVQRSAETDGLPTLAVQAVRMAARRGDRDQMEMEYVVEVVQKRRGYFDEAVQKTKDADLAILAAERGDFTFRRGCTLLIDARTLRVRRVIRTPGNVADNTFLDRVRQFVNNRRKAPLNAFDGGVFEDPLRSDDFAHLHRSAE